MFVFGSDGSFASSSSSSTTTNNAGTFVDDKERTSTDDGVSTEEDNSTDIVLLNELPSETWVDVVKKGKARSASKNERCVSRDHSLETIQ